MELPSSEWDHDYCRRFTRKSFFQCGRRSSGTVSNKFQQMETEPSYFQKDLQSLSDPRHKTFFRKNIVTNTGKHSLETGLIQQRNRRLSTILEESQAICLFPLWPHRTSFEESSSGKCHNNFNNSSMADITMIPKGTPDSHLQSSLNPKKGINFLIGPDFQSRSQVKSRTLQLVAWIVSRKNFSKRDYLKKWSPLSQVQEDQV